MGVFDALEKKYLSCLYFNVHDGDPDLAETKIVESYTFKTTYGRDARLDFSNGNEQRMKITKASIQASAKQMIKTLVVMTGALDALPENPYLTMYVTYTDATPIDYEPKGFRATTESDAKPEFDAETLSYTMGTIGTGTHRVVVKLRKEREIEPQEPSEAMEGLSISASGSSSVVATEVEVSEAPRIVPASQESFLERTGRKKSRVDEPIRTTTFLSNGRATYSSHFGLTKVRRFGRK